MPGFYPGLLAPAGSTGNNTHGSYKLPPVTRGFAAMLIVENGGATPTISWKLQGALDNDDVTDGNANWFDLLLLPANSDTVAAIPLVVSSATTGTVSAVYLAQGHIRFIRRVRAVTSANTNVTYRIQTVQPSIA